MLNIKKYANGRFFDTDAKKYIKAEKLSEIISNGEEIKVTLTKTGKDITAEVLEQFTKKQTAKKAKKSKKSNKKDIPFIKTEKLVKWVGDIIDTKINQVLDIVKLPSKEQVAQLDENIQALNKKIDELKVMTEKKQAAKKRAEKKKAPITEKDLKTEMAAEAPAPRKEGTVKDRAIEAARNVDTALEKDATPEEPVEA